MIQQEHQPPIMPTYLKVILAVAIILFAASAAALVVLSGMRGAATVTMPPGSAGAPLNAQTAALPDPQVEDLRILPFTLTTQDGATITDADLKGNVTIIDFMFTHCPLVCPMMTGTLADLADRLKGTDVRFLSISVDPDHDTPERLREFAGRYNADFSRWTFARGDRDATWRMVREGLMFAIGDDTDLTITLPDGSTMLNIRHPSHFVLVGRDGRVLGLYSSTDEDAVNRLEQRARLLANPR
jgi:protein SCO1/2